jgi:DNA-binding MarR family transcriptional regulator
MRAAKELRYLILALQREGNRLLAAGLRPLGLTPAQAEAIGILAAHAQLTLGGLGELLVCESGTNPSRIVDRLVSSDLVLRETEQHDRRRVVLSLTPEGREMAKRIAEVENKLHDALDRLVAGRPLDATLDLLRAMAADSPAGRAVALRRSGPVDR